jgi:hypothetical protein
MLWRYWRFELEHDAKDCHMKSQPEADERCALTTRRLLAGEVYLVASAALTCQLLFVLANSGRAEIVGDAELLAEVARRHRANKERIVTWQGRVLVSYQSSTPA